MVSLLFLDYAPAGFFPPGACFIPPYFQSKFLRHFSIKISVSLFSHSHIHSGTYSLFEFPILISCEFFMGILLLGVRGGGPYLCP